MTARKRRKPRPRASLASHQKRLNELEARSDNCERASKLVETAARQALGIEGERDRVGIAALSERTQLAIRIVGLIASALVGALASYLAR